MRLYAFIEEVSLPQALLISLLAVAVVIGILALIIAICSGVFAGINGVDGKFHINAKKQNKILDEDPDAAIALLVATIDFNKETGKNARVKSIKRVD
ncbi:MAG: hypothetical protein MJ248_00450 [Bacilli bacterium]|nr:hypothetical protein [Bacilli bacterium]